MPVAFEARLADLLWRTQFPGLLINAYGRENRVYLQVGAPLGSPYATCAFSGESLPWKGRKWLLSEHMTDGEIVQTAFMAVMAALEHEARERFTFDGVTVFDPHYDIHKLVQLRASSGAIVERS